jgi:hypothetical protein
MVVVWVLLEPFWLCQGASRPGEDHAYMEEMRVI